GQGGKRRRTGVLVLQRRRGALRNAGPDRRGRLFGCGGWRRVGGRRGDLGRGWRRCRRRVGRCVRGRCRGGGRLGRGRGDLRRIRLRRGGETGGLPGKRLGEGCRDRRTGGIGRAVAAVGRRRGWARGGRGHRRQVRGGRARGFDRLGRCRGGRRNLRGGRRVRRGFRVAEPQRPERHREHHEHERRGEDQSEPA